MKVTKLFSLLKSYAFLKSFSTIDFILCRILPWLQVTTCLVDSSNDPIGGNHVLLITKTLLKVWGKTYLREPIRTWPCWKWYIDLILLIVWLKLLLPIISKLLKPWKTQIKWNTYIVIWTLSWFDQTHVSSSGHQYLWIVCWKSQHQKHFGMCCEVWCQKQPRLRWCGGGVVGINLIDALSNNVTQIWRPWNNGSNC